MTPEEFVEAIRLHVMDAAVKSTVQLVSKPPGRSPEAELVAVSKWFNGLSEQDRETATRLVALASHAAVFGFLVTLDGSRRIHAASGTGDDHFELKYVHDGESDLLVGEAGGVLHELL